MNALKPQNPDRTPLLSPKQFSLLTNVPLDSVLAYCDGKGYFEGKYWQELNQWQAVRVNKQWKLKLKNLEE